MLKAVLILSVMSVVGLAFQVVTPFVAPSVSVAFLDGGIFRSWMGLGLWETLLQSIVFTLLLWTWSWGLHQLRVAEALRLPQLWGVLVLPMILPFLVAWWISYSALRLPTNVVTYWGALAVCQIASGAGILLWLSQGANETRLIGRRVLAAEGVCLFVSLGLLAVAYGFPTPRPDEQVTLTRANGEVVRIDCFRPHDASEKSPAVIVLHGVEGATSLTRRFVHYPNARAIADQGYVTFFVRYLDATNHEHLLFRQDGQLDIEAIEVVRRQHYGEWIDTVCEAFGVISQRVDVDPERIGIIGYSLGCYVGTAATTRLSGTPAPAAMVGNFGAIWSEIRLDASFPPVQFHHGTEDPVIPLQLVEETVARLVASGAQSVELVPYAGQGHVPEGIDSLLIRQRTEEFLNRFLQ